VPSLLPEKIAAQKGRCCTFVLTPDARVLDRHFTKYSVRSRIPSYPHDLDP